MAKQLADCPSSSFGANTEKNPKEECKAVMTRSRLATMNEREKGIGAEKQQLVTDPTIDPVVEPLSEYEEEMEVEDGQKKTKKIKKKENSQSKEREKTKRENSQSKNGRKQKKRERKFPRSCSHKLESSPRLEKEHDAKTSLLAPLPLFFTPWLCFFAPIVLSLVLF